MKPPVKPSVPARGRKKYSKPVLKTYGAIRSLTRNVGVQAVTADGAGFKSKTS